VVHNDEGGGVGWKLVLVQDELALSHCG